MPKQPVDFKLFPFDGGLNNWLDPALLPPGTLALAQDVNIDTGAVRGLASPGSSGDPTSIPSGTQFLMSDGGGGWIHSTDPLYGVSDGTNIYLTQKAAAPVIYNASGNKPLGIAVPTGTTSCTFTGLPSDGSQGPGVNYYVQYYITYVTNDGLESNAQKIDCTALPQGSLSFAKVTVNYHPSPDSRVTTTRIYRAEWKTGGEPVSYWVGDLPAADNYFDDAGATGDPTRQLTWGPGGFRGSNGYTSDHSTPPVLAGFSTGFHSTPQTGSGSGFPFGWNGKTLYWPQYGAPWYWPTRNTFTFPENIEAVITHTSQTVIITQSAIYVATGYTDDTVTITKSNANIGCLPGSGRACIYTPYGIVFPSIRGLEIFDGANSHPITQGTITEYTITSMAIRSACFWGGKYLLFHGGTDYDTTPGTLIADLRLYPTVRFTTSTQAVSIAATAFNIYPETGSAASPIQPFCTTGVTSTLTGSYTALTNPPNFANIKYLPLMAGNGKKVLVAGGRASNPSTVSDTYNQGAYVYDIAGGTWATVASLPVDIGWAKAITVDTDTVVVAGTRGCYRYSFNNNTWTQLPMPNYGLTSYGANALNWQFALAYDPTTKQVHLNGGYPGASYSGYDFALDTTTWTWASPTNGSGGTFSSGPNEAGHGLIINNGVAVEVGGVGYANSVYQWVAPNWTQKATLPHGANMVSAIPSTDGLYAIGNDTTTDRLYHINTTTWAVTELAGLPQGANSAFAVAGGCAAYYLCAAGFYHIT